MILNQFKDIYQTLDKDNIDKIEAIYADDIFFADPFHQVEGLSQLKKYFFELYLNVESIDFEFGEALCEGDSYFIQWTMKLTHPRLNNKKPFYVPGATYLKVNQKSEIVFHRDYFDAGVMLYERLPIFGSLIRWIKRKV